MRRRRKLIIGVVLVLALLICGVTYLLLIEWPSMTPQGVETELLRSGEPTRTVWLGEYFYDVRFYDASDSEVAMIGASIRKEAWQPQRQLTVSLSHHVETWEMLLDGPNPSTTHLESLSLTFNFSRPIETLPFPLWLLPPIRPTQFPSNISGSFSLESRIVDLERGVLQLNFSRLRNLEVPLMGHVRRSWISFEFLMAQEHAFTLEVSFTLHLPSGGKVMYEKGTTRALEFQSPAGATSQEATSFPSTFEPRNGLRDLHYPPFSGAAILHLP